MELKQRKKIANRLPKFDPGNDAFPIRTQDTIYGENIYNDSFAVNPQPDAYSILAQTTRSINDPNAGYREYHPYEEQSPVDDKGIVDYNPGLGGSMGGSKSGGGKSGGGVNPNGIVAGATNLIGGILSQQSSVKGRDELLADAGRSNQSVMGINYQSQNSINSAAEKRSLDNAGLKNTVGTAGAGAMLGGSIVPGIGHAVGAAAGAVAGLVSWGFSKHKLRKRIANAQHLAMRRNTANQAGAMSSALTQNYYQENGNTAGGILYANRGKDLRQPKYEK